MPSHVRASRQKTRIPRHTKVRGGIKQAIKETEERSINNTKDQSGREFSIEWPMLKNRKNKIPATVAHFVAVLAQCDQRRVLIFAFIGSGVAPAFYFPNRISGTSVGLRSGSVLGVDDPAQSPVGELVGHGALVRKTFCNRLLGFGNQIGQGLLVRVDLWISHQDSHHREEVS